MFGFLVTHIITLALGFALGIYALPLLIAPPSPTIEQITASTDEVLYRAEFVRDLDDSDFFHWGEGHLAINRSNIVFTGDLAPGPDYRLYLSPVFVETESGFEQHRASMTYVADVKTFKNFIVSVPPSLDVSAYNSVIVWCESFGEFITAAQYRQAETRL